jgi:hypothetical protein
MINKMCVLLAATVSLLWTGCNSEKRMIQVYNKHKQEMIQLTELSFAFYNSYKFEYSYLRYMGDDVGIRFSAHDQGAFSGTGEYFDSDSFEPMPPISPGDTVVCIKCNYSERNRYVSMTRDVKLKKIMRIFMDINPNAIEITSSGVFFALGSAVTTNNTEVEAGVFVAYSAENEPNQSIKKIDDNVYLYEAVIR